MVAVAVEVEEVAVAEEAEEAAEVPQSGGGTISESNAYRLVTRNSTSGVVVNSRVMYTTQSRIDVYHSNVFVAA